MEQPQPILVRGRCACGKRYRIRNAQPGVTVVCPVCRRPIPITEADLRAAFNETRLIPVQTETVELLEAIPVDHGELSLAAEGSRPGLTGELAYAHEDAALYTAMRGNPLAGRSTLELPGRAVQRFFARIEPEPVERRYWHDLLASFYLARDWRNVPSLLIVATAFTLLAMLLQLPKLGLFLLFPVLVGLAVFVAQYLWATLRRTAFGEDRVPAVASENSLWHDGFKPLFWVVLVAAVCTAPAWSLHVIGSLAVPIDPPFILLALAGGWFLWPVAMMSVGLGNSIALLRPDYLVKCIGKLGGAYFAAWATMGLAMAAVAALAIAGQKWPWIGLAVCAAGMYVLYVMFRTLGLLYRHYHEKFPWRF